MSEQIDLSPIIFIGGGLSDTQDVAPEMVGSKAYHLMRMDRMGLPVPPTFVLSTDFFHRHATREGLSVERLASVLPVAIRRLENATETTFGSARRPLLVSVRSSSPVSMPGMMETILNVGLSDKTLHGLIRRTGNPRLAWDSYRRLIQTFAVTVAGCPNEVFQRGVRAHMEAEGLPAEQELDSETLHSIADEHLRLYKDLRGCRFPQNPMDQLVAAVNAVGRSWFSARAAEYRRLHQFDEATGMAIAVQTMVFGNAGGTSGSGVAFTRNPATGADELYLDFLFNAQGDDVVGGHHAVADTAYLPTVLPSVYATLEGVRGSLEAEFGDLQDFEFTVEEGKLFFLQTRTGKRTPWAGLHIAIDMVDQGLIDERLALRILARYDLEELERARLVTRPEDRPLTIANPASIGVAVGRIALDPERARAMAAEKGGVILVRETTSPDDIAGIAVADGILTGAGGRTSHAAVVARQLGKVCLVGCAGLQIDATYRTCRIGARTCAEGETITLDGESGAVYAGRLDVERERPEEALRRVSGWRKRPAVATS